MASSEYHSRCRCGLNERPSGRRCGRTWRAEVGVSGGGASKQGGAKCCYSPNQGPPDLSMGRVSAAGQSYALGCLPQPAGRGSSYLDKIIAQVCTNCILMNIFTLVCTIGALDGIVCTSGTVSAHLLKNISGVHNTCSHCALCALCALCAHCAHHVHTETTRCSAPLLRNKAES